MTGRPRKLNDDAQELIKSRIDIARSSSILDTNEIATGFDVSVATLRRYYFPNERALSLEVSTKRYYTNRSLGKNMCEDCKKSLGRHDRCKDCTILIHFDPIICWCGEQHGMKEGKYCLNCFDARMRGTIG